MKLKKQKRITKKLAAFWVSLVGLMVASPVFAVGTTLEPPIKTNDVSTLIGNIIKMALSTFGALALLMFIIGGLTWMTSMGDAAKIKKGRDTVVWAALGIVLAFCSYAMVKFVYDILMAK